MNKDTVSIRVSRAVLVRLTKLADTKSKQLKKKVSISGVVSELLGLKVK